MIKKLRYLCTLLLIAVASTAWGDEVTFSYSDFTGGTQSTGSPISTSSDYVTFAESKGYANTSFVNLYASGVITITPKSGYKVTNVVITASATNYNGYQSGGTITASEGTVSGEGTTITWIGESTEGFTLSHYKQIRMTKVTITYLSTSSNPAVSTPTFTPTAGVYTSAQSVAISCETEGATIYYTTDGSTPNNESNEYTGAIKVSTTMTIKAIAVKSNMENSVVASATYAILAHNGSKSDPYTVADARTAIDANNGVENVYATGIVSKIVTAYNSSYGNITYDISVDGEESSDQLRVYRCKNSDAGEPDVADVQKGDVVVVYGNLTKFGTTYEFGEGCQLISRTSSSSQVAAGISFSDTSAEADLADLSSFTAPTFSNPNNLTVTFTSSNEEVATVSADGSVTILAEGTTKIIATSEETEQYLAGEASYTLRVINSNKVLVTVDADGNTIFDLSDNAWKFPTGKQVDEGSFTNNGYTIKVAGTTGNGYYFYANGNALLFGKSGAYLTLPAFGYDVDKIDVVGSSGASEVVKQNIFVGETAVSTETTGAKDVTNTYAIAEEYQAAGNVYTLKVTSAHNTQVTKIIVYKAVADERADAEIAFDPATLTVTQGEEVEAPVFLNPNSISESEITFASDNEDVADWDDSGLVFGTATGTATITAKFEGNESYKPATAKLVVTVNERQELVDVVIEEEGQTTFLFNTEGNEWGFPTTKTVAEGLFTANEKTIKVAGSTDNGYSYNTKDKYLLIGKKGAYLTLPAFDFEVGKIEVVGRTGASGKVTQNIFVNVDGEDVAVSTGTTGITSTQSYIIADGYRAAGNVYTLKVTNDNNTQVTQIVVYKATGAEKANPQLKYSAATATATLGSEFAAPTLSYVDGFDGTVVYESSDERVATVDAEGNVTLVAAGETIIKATSAETDNYLPGEAFYTLTVKEPAVVGDNKYELVTDASTLKAGDEILIAYVDDDGATVMGEQKSNNRAGVAAIVNEDNTITPNSDAQTIMLEEDAENGWYFNVGTGYLYASSSSANQLKTENAIDDNGNAKATIAIDSNNATIIFQGNNTRNLMRFNPNNGSPLFACYALSAETGFLPQIYRKVSSTETPSGNVNGDTDGKVDIADVTALVNIIVNNSDPTPEQLAAGDFDNSGTLTVEDVEALVNKILSNQ